MRSIGGVLRTIEVEYDLGKEMLGVNICIEQDLHRPRRDRLEVF